MPSLIVVRIVPKLPVRGDTFTGFLNPSLGNLQITAFDLSFGNPTIGTNVGSASYVAPTSLVSLPGHPDRTATPPPYPPGLTSGIVQQVDFVFGLPPYFQLDAVATAVIEIASPPPTFENLRLEASWGTGAGRQVIPVPFEYYDVALVSGSPPADPNDWAALAPSAYLSLPRPPGTTSAVSFALPADGTAPPFDELHSAVTKILASDPGGAPPDLATLSPDQCRNIAYEIVWSQQDPLPTPPDPIQELYTNPPNTGVLLSGSTPNEFEGDRHQFEATLQSYYAVANATADRLTNFVYSLAAAVACEEMSLTATEALLRLPVDPGGSSPPLTGDIELILTGLGGVQPPTNFGIPAAYFYGLHAMMPTAMTAERRYQLALGDRLQRVLSQLTSAINAATITDSETFTSLAPGPPAVSAAQAARRIGSLGVPTGITAPFAPLDTVALRTSAATAAGTVLPFIGTGPVSAGMSIGGLNIGVGTTVTGVAPASVTLSQPIGGPVPSGATIVFTPALTTDLQQLLQGWIAFPPAVAGPPSSQTYHPADDDQLFWPTQASLHQPAFVNLILSALTEGYIVPAPLNVALGDKVIQELLAGTPTLAALKALTASQWTAFFKGHPTWLPDFTQPGNTDARIAAFIRHVERFFTVHTAGPLSVINLATSADTPGGATLPFVSTAGVVVGMSVSGLNMPTGATVTAVTPTSVTLSAPILADVPPNTNITFTPNYTGVSAAGQLPLLQQPPTDWIADCLAAFDSLTGTTYVLGSGSLLLSTISLASSADTPGGATLPFVSTAGVVVGMSVSGLNIPPGATVAAVTPTSVTLSGPILADVPPSTDITFTPPLRVAAASVFPNDQAAQDWLVDAVETLDHLYQILKSPPVVFPPPDPNGFEFSVAEALYARGFKSAGDITELSSAQFADALTGTIAYDLASEIYTSASAITPPSSTPTGDGGFAPVNPDGSLTNCIPPECLSPLGPVAYLSEMLQVSEASTCDKPLDPAAPKPLGVVLAGRRGPLGALSASCANLETPLPLIDIVNECLEFMGSVATPTHGAVYDTADEDLAGHALCDEDDDRAERRRCHVPARIFEALPEYSTPATPVAANSSVEPAVYNTLKNDFSTCDLPYSQALDVSRTYLRHFKTCRFAAMRTFRRCITEFVLDPVAEPVGFQSHLWRYPVRIDTAIEYLEITPEEYTAIYGGVWPEPCGPTLEDQPRDEGPARLAPWHLYGLPYPGEENAWVGAVIQLPDFLSKTCLSYCEFLELWKSGFVLFRNGADRETGVFPDCEPCCLDDLWLEFPGEDGAEDGLYKLAVFVRLWRKLRTSCEGGYPFDQLRDICNVLHLFNGSAVNPDFIRQLVAFEMLRDQFRLPLRDRRSPLAAGAVDAERTQILALWVGSTAAAWQWALDQVIEGVEHHGLCDEPSRRRTPEFLKVLSANFDPLSRLAGFDPSTPTDTWSALPTHTLRFVEILAKIYASHFTVEEILYLFTADEHLEGEDPFALQSANEALDLPFDLPDDLPRHSLYSLRRKLLEVELDKEEVEEWGWRRVEAVLQGEFGFAHSSLLTFGQHFFPDVLEDAGYSVEPKATRFLTDLPAANTVPTQWNSPADGPLRYDLGQEKLWTRLPLRDRAVIHNLRRLPALNAAERRAVQDLFFQPRAELASFALLFQDFESAERRLIEEDDDERWRFFRRQVLLCHRRRRIIAEHLAEHVAATTNTECGETVEAAELVLSHLFADENKATSDWEDDSGATPTVTWTPPPNGSAVAALLGLVGTGLSVEYADEAGTPVWRDASGPLDAFGHERNEENCPLPTVLPPIDLALPAEQLQFVTVRNGLGMEDASGRWLGGMAGFRVKWSGAVLIDREGEYEFIAGTPAPEDEEPRLEDVEDRSWRVLLKRGQRQWILLAHRWPGEERSSRAAVRLKPGTYELDIDLIQPSPTFDADVDVRPQRTGFQLKYRGADTQSMLIEVPHDRLFQIAKNDTLGNGINAGSPAASAYLATRYVSSLRDIRRTYQRAFKGLLFARRFPLIAQRIFDRQSELGYMLQQKAEFAGSAYFRSGGGFSKHAVDFDFNFLPQLDTYHPPALDSRTHPSVKRKQAMFDWWERLFDYCRARERVHRHCERHLWLLFEDALQEHPADPRPLLRHLCTDARHWALDLRYFQNRLAPVYSVSSTDLQDDRWVVRAWHAEHWLRELDDCFCARDVTLARPDLWVADDPSVLVPGEAATGNANLSQFLADGCLERGTPPRYEELKLLNDALRDRGRKALIASLCAMDRVPLPWAPGTFATTATDLSDLLLLDVHSGMCERASRIDDAITAVQTFVSRARVGLEPDWNITRDFARLWDQQFQTFRVWQACKRRQLYKENTVQWFELERARRIEAFQFLESELARSAATVAGPGGLEWWPDELPSDACCLPPLQVDQPSTIASLPTPREGLDLLGTPEQDARPSWLAAAGNLVRSDNRAEVGPVVTAADHLPFWIQAAIRLGTRFFRIAAAGVPPAAEGFVPHPKTDSPSKCDEGCHECGRQHPHLVDEYYFWLLDASYYAPPQPSSSLPTTEPDDYQNGYQDDYYDPSQQQAAYWWDPNQLPQLLDWPSSPMVRLAWCRVHNGEFQQPRRSVEGVAVGPGDVDLQFVGRTADSLTFEITNPAVPSPQPGHLDPSPPGFRYDLALDDAAVLPLVGPAPTSPSTFPGGLPAYPYFVYHDPGTHLLPPPIFSFAIAIAATLRAHCCFEAALRWYRLAFDPPTHDCTWIACAGRDDRQEGGPLLALREEPGARSGCCDATDVTCAVVRNRSILLLYLETLQEWGEALMRRKRPEAFQQARVLFDMMQRILGEAPRPLYLPQPETPSTVASFEPAFAPLNPRLLELYRTVRDRRDLIQASLDAPRLRNGRLARDMPYFGDDVTRGHWRTQTSLCLDESDWCYLHSPYRFVFLVQKAEEFAAKVSQFGAELLAAFEKGDAEYLAARRAEHERELLLLGLDARRDQWREADWQVQALQKTKAVSQANFKYFTGLIQAGLISGEIAYQDLTIASTVLRGVGNVFEGVAQGVGAIPNTFIGVAGFGGTPLEYEQLPIGTPLAGIFSTIARVMNSLAEVATSTAGLELTEAGWQRRSDEWIHQTQVLSIEIQQVERQIVAAQRRRDQALQELNSHQRQIEQSTEVRDFLRDKFTRHPSYLHLQRETAALYYQTYDIARHLAAEAERAFNFERGWTTRRFLLEDGWDSLHEGLLAGEQLELALRRMEKAYLDENVREYELTKHISLRLNFPLEYIRLRTTGYCEIDIPEWMFDVDYPGMYLRLIKNVTLTVPCVTGPYTGVHCRLTLLSSTTRIEPTLADPPRRCCSECQLESSYEACPHDPRVVRQYAACDAIATSRGQNDSGMFELNFRDERYLPFEFLGAVSRWRIELPLENNYFDFETLSDVILHLNYTAREGGELLRRAASRDAQRHLPGDGWRVFDVRHDFPGEWAAMHSGSRVESDEDVRPLELELRLHRNLFPFIPGERRLSVDRFGLVFENEEDEDEEEREEHEARCWSAQECRCPNEKSDGCFVLELALAREGGRERRRHGREGDLEPRRSVPRELPASGALPPGRESAWPAERDWDRERDQARQQQHERDRDWDRDRDGDRHRDPHRRRDRDWDWDNDVEMICVRDAGCPELYYGLKAAHTGALGRPSARNMVRICFPAEVRRVPRLFLVCHYVAVGEVAASCSGPEGVRA